VRRHPSTGLPAASMVSGFVGLDRNKRGRHVRNTMAPVGPRCRPLCRPEHLEAAAAKLPVPKAAGLVFKPKAALRFVGRETSIYDQLDIVTGKAQFGLDVVRDGMVYASIEHPPVLGGTVKAVDAAATKAVKGVRTPSRSTRSNRRICFSHSVVLP
jgi:hypothetical protein